MTTKKEPHSAEPQDSATNDDVAAELSSEAVRNLTGFFDVLIQMDFALKQRNEQRKVNDDFLQDAKDMPKQAG